MFIFVNESDMYPSNSLHSPYSLCFFYFFLGQLGVAHAVLLLSTTELKDVSEMDMSDVQKNLKSLYEYNVMLREKFVAVQSVLHELATKPSSPGNTDNHDVS